MGGVARHGFFFGGGEARPLGPKMLKHLRCLNHHSPSSKLTFIPQISLFLNTATPIFLFCIGREREASRGSAEAGPREQRGWRVGSNNKRGACVCIAPDPDPGCSPAGEVVEG